MQKELSAAQDAVTERDPLMAARLFARAASDAMSRRPPDLRWAMAYQADASKALSRAWIAAVHQAAELRLSELPSLQAVYGPPPPALRDTPSANVLSPNLGSHDWVRLHTREGGDRTATMRDSDPPGYEEQLRLYFEAMNKSQEKQEMTSFKIIEKSPVLNPLSPC